jgi:hypothetical protein
MPEICHSFVSRYAAIASAARNERDRPVLLASFWSLLLVKRSTRTENVSVFICVHCITRTEMCYEAVRRGAFSAKSFGSALLKNNTEHEKADSSPGKYWVVWGISGKLSNAIDDGTGRRRIYDALVSIL